MFDDIVAVTTFRQGDPCNPIEKLRSEVFFDMVKTLAIKGISCITIFIDCEESYLEAIRDRGVVPIPQQSCGMGNVRREALRTALILRPHASYYLWLEPEKSHIPLFVAQLKKHMRKNNAILGLFNRIHMDSYPEEQAYCYLLWRAIASKFVGFDLDYGFGPMIVTKASMPYFLEYRGEYGDKWDALLVPRLRIIKDGASIAILPIDFRNDPRMTEIESGNPTIILKRLEQLNNIITSLVTEWHT